MAFVPNGEFGKRVVEALGLKDQFVKSIDVHIAVDELVTADVTTFVPEGEELARCFEVVEWKERNPYSILKQFDQWFACELAIRGLS